MQELTHEVYGVPKSIDIAIDVLVNEGNLIPMELFNLGGMYTDNSRKDFGSGLEVGRSLQTCIKAGRMKQIST